MISKKTTYKKTLAEGDTELGNAVLPYMNNMDFICSEIEFKSQTYKNGQIVVLEVYDPDEIKVGLVMTILGMISKYQ